MVPALLLFVWLVAALAFTYWLFVLVPAEMAACRNRNVVGWVLISFLGSPPLAIVLLWMLGEKRRA